MSGTPVPVHIITEPFGTVAAALPQTDPGGVTLPIPVASQVGILVGAASFADGMPAATMVDIESEGGVPPFGQDMNGILYMATAYCALLQAGQRVNWDAAAVAAFTGYAIGAEVASATVPGRVWVNWLDGNVNDPDAVDTGWAASDPLAATIAPAAGVLNNLALPGASDFALDIDTTAGNIDLTGIVAQRNGQKLFVSNTGANLLQFLALNAGSAVANRFRAATDLAVVQNQTLTLEWFSGLNKWLFT
jgi:hypothetical protein